jgi:4-hydroxy-3-polyprenylbenzoate decarboxylase
MENIVVGICGASGVVLGIQTVRALLERGVHVHLVASTAAHITAAEELGWRAPFRECLYDLLDKSLHPLLNLYDEDEVAAKIASGSFRTRGMVIVPCSMATLAAVRVGLADTLLRRAADVTIKEGRRLVMVTRETPLSVIHLENMAYLAKLGVVIMPPVPAWYHRPQTLGEMESQLVEKIIDQLGVASFLREWEPRSKFI